MATQGLFMDPQAAADARLVQLSQMDPNQRLFLQAARGGQQLGQGVGSLFGQDVRDPAVIRATKMRELAAKYGVDTAEGLDKIAMELQATDPNMAMQVAEKANELRLQSSKLSSEQALTAQRTAAANKETKLATPADIVKAQRIAALRSAIPAYEAAGDTVTAKQLKDELEALLPADKIPSFGAEADRIAVAKYGKPFGQLTREQAAEVDKTIEQRDLASRKAGKTDVVLPGLDKAGDITGFRKDVQAITKPYQDRIDSADDAISLANDAIKTGNFASAESLSRSLAKSSGEQQITNRDVSAFGSDPSLVGTVSDTLSRLTKGRPTIDTLTKLRQLAELIKKKNEARLMLEEDQLRATARSSKLYTDEQLNTVFRRRPATGGGKTRTTKSGVTYTVEND